MIQEIEDLKTQLRIAVANYISSEGCGCCSDHKAHTEHGVALAKLLDALYGDDSGFDFTKYMTPK